MSQVQTRQIECFLVLATSLLLISTMVLSYEVFKLQDQVDELKRTLDILDELTYEFNCELRLQEKYNLNVTNVDMINHFTFQVTLSNGTVLRVAERYPDWIFRRIS